MKPNIKFFILICFIFLCGFSVGFWVPKNDSPQKYWAVVRYGDTWQFEVEAEDKEKAIEKAKEITEKYFGENWRSIKINDEYED